MDRKTITPLPVPGTKYSVFHTAFGPTAVVFQDGPLPVKRIVLPTGDASLREKTLLETYGPPSMASPAVSSLCRGIQAYFEGVPLRPRWELLDLRGFTSLQQKVLKTVATVGYGQTETYARVAVRIGRPRAYRFVGTTLARNPFPVLIPCHRIIRANGVPGGFAGGEGLKVRMLTLEATGRK